jgi:hypothetical protein
VWNGSGAMVRRLDLRDDGHPVQPAVVVAQEEQGSWCNGLKVSTVKKNYRTCVLYNIKVSCFLFVI